MGMSHRKRGLRQASLYDYHHRNHSMDVTVKGRVALRRKS